MFYQTFQKWIRSPCAYPSKCNGFQGKYDLRQNSGTNQKLDKLERPFWEYPPQEHPKQKWKIDFMNAKNE